jgi:acetyl-CoA carboxylase biotin carboxyl carrier protein
MPKKKKTESDPDVEVRGVDLGEVRRLLDFMRQHDLEEFEYESKDFHVRLKKASPQGDRFRAGAISESAHAVHDSLSANSAPFPAPAATRGPAAEAALPDDVHVVKSPIVGTFYAAPNPDADPFVKAGAKVKEGDVLGIIEAMKLMNEIESDVAGEVVQVFVENGSPVEYGEPLFGIRTSRKK